MQICLFELIGKICYDIMINMMYVDNASNKPL